MSWSGIPAGASSVHISAIGAGVSKLLGYRVDNGIASPWAWTVSNGDSTFDSSAVVVDSVVASISASLAIYRAANPSTGAFTLWDGAISRTFSWLTGRDSIQVQAVSHNGDYAVVAGLLGSAWSFSVIGGLLNHLSSGSGVTIRDINAPSGYAAYLTIGGVSDTGMVFGTVTASAGSIKKVFYSDTSGDVGVISDSSYGAGIFISVAQDSAGSDSVLYTLYTPQPLVRVFTKSGGATNIPSTYGAYGNTYNSGAIYGSRLTSTGGAIPAKWDGAWADFDWPGGNPFGDCLFGTDTATLILGDGDDTDSVGQRVRLYSDEDTYEELPLPPGWPSSTAQYVYKWAMDLSAFVVSCEYYNEATEEYVTGAYLWTSTGYEALDANNSPWTSSLVAKAAVTCSLSIGVAFMAGLSCVTSVISNLPQESVELDAAIAATASASSGLSTEIKLNTALVSNAGFFVDLAAPPALDAALYSIATAIPQLTTRINLDMFAAARASAYAALTVPTGFAAAVAGSAEISGEITTHIFMRCAAPVVSRCATELTTGIILSSATYACAKIAARLQRQPPTPCLYIRYSPTNVIAVRTQTPW